MKCCVLFCSSSLSLYSFSLSSLSPLSLSFSLSLLVPSLPSSPFSLSSLIFLSFLSQASCSSFCIYASSFIVCSPLSRAHLSLLSSTSLFSSSSLFSFSLSLSLLFSLSFLFFSFSLPYSFLSLLPLSLFSLFLLLFVSLFFLSLLLSLVTSLSLSLSLPSASTSAFFSPTPCPSCPPLPHPYPHSPKRKHVSPSFSNIFSFPSPLTPVLVPFFLLVIPVVSLFLNVALSLTHLSPPFSALISLSLTSFSWSTILNSRLSSHPQSDRQLLRSAPMVVHISLSFVPCFVLLLFFLFIRLSLILSFSLSLHPPRLPLPLALLTLSPLILSLLSFPLFFSSPLTPILFNLSSPSPSFRSPTLLHTNFFLPSLSSFPSPLPSLLSARRVTM
ncbi:hypothetical protein C7M84_022149 [Penaeus vannamei]|uniref:Uncharacterized protein n=1 Tax=Penaeus vannamei TaxID=6689 RepID=A0A423U7G2_PENVA|nr:hypothetical protein C7M84_022149 [Penaeus vannamei]